MPDNHAVSGRDVFVLAERPPRWFELELVWLAQRRDRDATVGRHRGRWVPAVTTRRPELARRRSPLRALWFSVSLW